MAGCVALGLVAQDLRADSQVVAWGSASYGQSLVPDGLTNVVAVSDGASHCIALAQDGTLKCWGDNNSQESKDWGFTNVIGMQAGNYRSLAVKADGSLFAWGNGYLSGKVLQPSGVFAVSSGYEHIVALNFDGTVTAWGGNTFDQTSVPPGLTNVTAISAGLYHTLALTADGTVVAWGANDSGQCNVPAGLNHVVAVAAGNTHDMALLSDGTIVAWGDDTYGKATPPAGLSDVVAISAGYDHSLALKGDGTVVAWGMDGSPQVAVPSDLAGVVAIASGSAHNLAIVGSGAPRIQGVNPDRTGLYGGMTQMRVNACGALPLVYQWRLNGTNIPGATGSQLILTNLDASRIGSYSVVVNNSLGAATNSECRLDAAPLVILSQPASTTAQAGDAVSFSVAVASLVDVRYQWFCNGEALEGETNSTLTLPVFDFSQIGTYAVVVSNQYASITSAPARLANKNLFAWGDGSSHQTTIPSNLTYVTSIAAGSAHGMAITGNGSVRAWGSLTNVPAAATNVIALAGGTKHAVALRQDGTVIAWGDGYNGSTNVPAGLSGVRAITACSYYGAALKNDGSVVAWGQRENVTMIWTTYVTNDTSKATNLVAIDAGRGHMLGLRADGTVLAWGYNGYKQTNVPKGLDHVVAISAGAYFSVALKADGTVVAWGQNSNGQTNVPAGLNGVKAISAGDNFCLAILKDGTVTSWGSNLYGQSTIPSGLSNAIQVVAGDGFAIGLGPDGGPIINQQPPAALAVGMGATLNLTIGLNEIMLQPASYQWYFNGAAIPNATSETLTVANMTADLLGLYYVVVSNALRSVTSVVSTVTATPVNILSQPQPQSAVLGGSAVFTVILDNPSGSTYQWQFNGVDIPGATQSALTLTNIVLANRGSYSVVMQNPSGICTSATAALTVTELVAWGQNSWRQTNIPSIATNLAAVAPGAFHTLALRGDGTVVAWGKNIKGQARVPDSVTNAIGIAAGGDHSLALLGDGSLVAWGDNVFGQTLVPAAATNVVSIAAGWAHSLALRADGTVVAWGNDEYGQCEVSPAATEVISIAAGYYHSVALKADGSVVSWGDAAVPASATNIVAISAGWGHTLALRADGTVMAWGDNTFNQATVPAEATNVVAIAAGWYHNLALRADGTMFVWGKDILGATKIRRQLPTGVRIGVGEDYCVALVGSGIPRFQTQRPGFTSQNGSSTVLSANVIGALPLTYAWYCDGTAIASGTNQNLLLPAGAAKNGGHYVLVASNAYGTVTNQAIVLTTIDQPQTYALIGAWGDNTSGQCSVPVGITNPVAIAAGGFHNLALQADGAVIGWGKNNQFGQLAIPASVVNVKAISAGTDFSIALKEDGSVIAWGRNSDGETNVPAQASTATAIAAGWAHGLALTTNGTVVAWGNDEYGQTDVPAGLQNVVAIAAGYYHSVAILSNHTVVVWGPDDPVPASATNVIAVAAGWEHTLALRADGSIVAWGDNSYSQCNVPDGATNVVAIAAGYGHSLALRADGTCIAWGENRLGVTNPPASLRNVSSIACGENHQLSLVRLSSPYITRHPQSLDVALGGRAIFQADAEGTLPMARQWYFNDSPLASETNQLLVVDNVQAANFGSYVFKAVNRFGDAASLPALLGQFRSQPRFSVTHGSLVFLNGEFSLTADGFSAHGPIVVFASTNLTDWVPVLTNGPVNGVLNLIDTNGAAFPMRFYRIVEQ